jgi:hypothetical protein
MRVKRGTLPSEREGGRLYVLLNTEPTADPGRPHDRTNDRTSELIATLRGQLQAERQAHGEARRLLMAALERIPPQLEAPADSAPDAPETVEEQQGGGQPRPAAGGGAGGRTASVVAQGVRRIGGLCRKDCRAGVRTGRKVESYIPAHPYRYFLICWMSTESSASTSSVARTKVLLSNGTPPFGVWVRSGSLGWKSSLPPAPFCMSGCRLAHRCALLYRAPYEHNVR